MTGAAKAIDRQEEKFRSRNRSIAEKTHISSAGRAMAGDPLAAVGEAGELKRKYGQHNDIDTSQGYSAGKQAHEVAVAQKQAEEDQARADAEAKAESDAAAAAALEKSHASQRDALKRKGRRASILTSPQGLADPLGLPG
jgi:hypothetical protein